MRPPPSFLLLMLICSVCSLGIAQNLGDYQSVAAGNWNSTATWQTWNGSTWVAASSTPGASSTVYLTNAGVVTLTQNESCNDVHLRSSPTADKIVTGTYTLSVYGKIRAYTGNPPGTSSTSLPNSTTWINTTGGGKISFAGNGRAITSAGEWGANPPNWNMEIALNSGQVDTINTNFKAGDIVIASGTLSTLSNDLRADKNSAGTGSITVNAGATLLMGSGSLARTGTPGSGNFGSLTVNGNLIYSSVTVGSINANSITFGGTVQYTATGAQTLVQKTSGGGGSATPDTYSNLSVSGSGLKTLAMATKVNGTLTLGGTAGVALSGNNLTLGGTVVGGGPGTAIATNGTGGIVRQIATGGSFVFPLSTDGTDYNPATVLMGPTDATDTFTLRVTPGIVPSAPYDGSAVQRTWTVTKATPTANNVTLTFQWSGSQEGATFSRATADVWRYNGSSWVSVGTASSSGSDPYTLTVSGITAFSPFIVGNHGELPITLGAFAGSVRASGGVSLQWSTVSEINNYGFYVERAAAAAGDFVTISPLIPGHGTTNVQQHYGFVDHSPAPGSTWYRLKQVDLDQTVHMSDAILVQGSPAPAEQAPRVFELAQNYPNPFNPSTDIRFTVEKQGHASLKVYNSIGQEVAVLFDDNADAGRYYRVTLDGSKLASGVYFYRLDSNGKAQMRSLVLLK